MTDSTEKTEISQQQIANKALSDFCADLAMVGFPLPNARAFYDYLVLPKKDVPTT